MLQRRLLALTLGLAALTYGASLVVQRQTSAWFEKDLNLRARLAVSGSRSELAGSWRADRARLQSVLADIAQDERITHYLSVHQDIGAERRSRERLELASHVSPDTGLLTRSAFVSAFAWVSTRPATSPRCSAGSALPSGTCS